VGIQSDLMLWALAKAFSSWRKKRGSQLGRPG
jgi:hypothetical protein